MSLKEKIKTLSQSYLAEVIAYRRHLHTHPELSFQEHNTAVFISEQLTAFKIPHTTGIAGTGIVGILEGLKPGKKIISLRADMDALPIMETNEEAYQSQNPGVMHACGHDAHTASLLGCARILSEL